eukprot:1462436-Rhodomonas_salina.2
MPRAALIVALPPNFPFPRPSSGSRRWIQGALTSALAKSDDGAVFVHKALLESHLYQIQPNSRTYKKMPGRANS